MSSPTQVSTQVIRSFHRDHLPETHRVPSVETLIHVTDEPGRCLPSTQSFSQKGEYYTSQNQNWENWDGNRRGQMLLLDNGTQAIP